MDFKYQIDEPTAGGKLAVLLFWSICIIAGGLMLGAVLASVARIS